mgnify:CR=1 FL=1
MFTGIIEETGTITDLSPCGSGTRLTIRADLVLEDVEIGSSIAVNGCCLTVISYGENFCCADAVPETMDRTNLGSLAEKNLVNLERPVQANGRLGGHIVQGHIDSTGQLLNSVKEGNCWIMDFSIHKDIYDLTVLYGSITINGVSLTVSQLEESCICRVGVIPFTFEKTNLGLLQEGKKVNVEGDLVGKYISKFYSERDG